jgi:cyclohexanone monooxygenase
MDNFGILVTGGFQDEDMVNDGWTEIIRNILLLHRAAAAAGQKDPADLVQLADFKKMEQIRARIDAVVKDKRTAEALKPWYNQFCKRPCFHDDYLPTFNRPNVTLVDTEGRGVERITENAVIANGKAYEVDCLIYATGFEVGTDYTRRSGYDLTGRDGLTLSGKWSHGVSTLHGISSRGFPNAFVIQPSQAGFAVNFPSVIGEQARHIAYIMAETMGRQARTVEPSAAAEEAWVQTIIDTSVFNRKFQEECTPGYYNNEGKPNPLAIRNGPYGKGPIAYTRLLDDWREAGTLEGLELA